MVLSILGILIFIIASIYMRTMPLYAKLIRSGQYIGVALLVIGMATSCFVQVGPGQVGIQSLFGKIENSTLPSGLNFINPLMKVDLIDIKTQNYTMSAVHDEGDKAGDDAIHVLTSDGLEVTMDITVLFSVVTSEAPKLMREVGANYIDNIIRPIARTKIRDNVVYYQAVELYSTKRGEFQNRVYTAIEADFKKRGLLLEQLLIRNISLPASVKASIEEKINAEQASQKMQFVLQKEKQEAERKRLEATGIADYQRIISEGLTDKQLQYEQIKAYKDLATSPNSKIIFMGKGSGAPVILDAK